MAAAASALRPRLTRQAAPLIFPALAVVYALAAIRAVPGPNGSEPTTSYAAVSAGMHAVDLATGLVLLVVGAIASVTDVGRRLGIFAILLGALWFAPDWEGWIGHPVARSIGSFATPFLLVVILHLALAAPRTRLRSRAAVMAVGAAYAITALLAVGRALFDDPIRDMHCWRNCSDNVFLVQANVRIARDLDVALLGLSVAVGVLIVLVSGARLVGTTAVARLALMPILGPAAFLGAAGAAYAAAVIHTPLEDPRASTFTALFLVRAVALTALGLGIAWRVEFARRARSGVAHLAVELGEAPPPGRLQDVLATALGDPSIRVSYWLETSRRFVGADGRRLPEPVAAVGRALTPIVRRGRQLAVLTHDAAVVDGSALEQEIRPAARLAVENERLQAEVLAELDDLRRSRARIVERADTERQRLERNLHDGAQQRLLALSYDLRLARNAADADGDTELAALMESAVDDAHAALEELRELAHGIYPAILAEAGLQAALETLADEAPVPVKLKAVPRQRQPSSVEAAAYFAIAEAVDDAAARAATAVQVEVLRAGEQLEMTIDDDGADRRALLQHVSDRIGALGGSVELGPTTVRARIPCA